MKNLPKRLALACAAIAVAANLGGCAAGIPVATYVLAGQAALAVMSDAYCAGTTEDAKVAARAKLSNGVKVIPCDDPE